jgi:hypothetical protein
MDVQMFRIAAVQQSTALQNEVQANGSRPLRDARLLPKAIDFKAQNPSCNKSAGLQKFVS